MLYVLWIFTFSRNMLEFYLQWHASNVTEQALRRCMKCHHLYAQLNTGSRNYIGTVKPVLRGHSQGFCKETA